LVDDVRGIIAKVSFDTKNGDWRFRKNVNTTFRVNRSDIESLQIQKITTMIEPLDVNDILKPEDDSLENQLKLLHELARNTGLEEAAKQVNTLSKLLQNKSVNNGIALRLIPFMEQMHDGKWYVDSDSHILDLNGLSITTMCESSDDQDLLELTTENSNKITHVYKDDQFRIKVLSKNKTSVDHPPKTQIEKLLDFISRCM